MVLRLAGLPLDVMVFSKGSRLSPHKIPPGPGLTSTPHQTDFYFSSLKTQRFVSSLPHLELSSEPLLSPIKSYCLRSGLLLTTLLSTQVNLVKTTTHSTHSRKSKNPHTNSDLKKDFFEKHKQNVSQNGKDGSERQQDAHPLKHQTKTKSQRPKRSKRHPEIRAANQRTPRDIRRIHILSTPKNPELGSKPRNPVPD